MKKKLIIISGILLCFLAQAQDKSGIGIGVPIAHSSAMLEVSSQNKGVLIPRVAIKSISDTESIDGAVAESLLIYNTTESLVEGLFPGYHYWSFNKMNTSDSKWVRLLNDTDLVSELTAKNGVNIAEDVLKLGGALTETTVLTASTENTLAIQGLEAGSSSDQLVVSGVDGVLKKVNSAMPKFFYMPSILLDTETVGAEHTVNLYTEFTKQFSNIPATYNSTGAVANLTFIPQIEDLAYYITYADDKVIKIDSVSSKGEMKYTVIKQAKSTSFVNIVFVVK